MGVSLHAVRILIAVSVVSLPGAVGGLCGVRGKTNASGNDTSYRLITINRTRLYLNDRGGLPNITPVYPGHHIDLTGTYVHYDPMIYDQGPGIIGKLGGVPSAGLAYWGTSYVPGPIIQGQPALRVRPQDSLRYHPYRINASMSSLDSDVVDWPADLGAPVTPDGRPRLLGDELVWSIFNDADSTGHPYYSGDYCRMQAGGVSTDKEALDFAMSEHPSLRMFACSDVYLLHLPPTASWLPHVGFYSNGDLANSMAFL